MSPPQDAELLSPAVLDTSVLFDLYVRDVLLNLALDKRYVVRWSDRILEELRRALASRLLDYKIHGTINAMNEEFPRARVEGAHPTPGTPHLPDAHDTHVLSAAIGCGAPLIVTNNLRDFPEDTLDLVGIKAVSADTFLTWIFRENPTETLRVVKAQQLDYRRPPFRSLDEFADILESRGLETFSRALRGQRTSWRVSPSFR
ncbi:MAG: PIN domain-containing protein [bacterium]|nr:PIN domain-containing protein [bacterium]